MKKQNATPLTANEVISRQNLENALLRRDRYLNDDIHSLAHNLMDDSEEILNEVDAFNDPELSKAMRHTLCRIALA